MDHSSTLCLIPARGGSKGVKRKNLRLVGGMPLIYWTIKAAIGLPQISRIVVSTDDKEIFNVALDYGVEVMLRPPEISADDTPMIDVVNHALLTLNSNQKFDNLLLLQPTAPARTQIDISGALEYFESINKDSLVSVFIDADKHPARSYRIKDNLLVPFASEPNGSLRQNLDKVYHRNGAIYLSRVDFILKNNKIWSESPAAYVMPKERSLNIDDEFDLLIADLVMTHMYTQ